MINKHGAVARKIADPHHQARVVIWCDRIELVLRAALVLLLVRDAYAWVNPPQVGHFLIEGKGPPRPVAAHDSPVLSDAQLFGWTVKAVLAPYNVNYYAYPQQLNTASRRFTLHGWNTFAESYGAAVNGHNVNGNFAEMIRAGLHCYAQTERDPIYHLDHVLVVGGLTAREVEVPIVQTCGNTNGTVTQHLRLIATVARIDTPAHPDGLAIARLVAAAA